MPVQQLSVGGYKLTWAHHNARSWDLTHARLLVAAEPSTVPFRNARDRGERRQDILAHGVIYPVRHIPRNRGGERLSSGLW
jgi:hypothetical protein